MSWIVTTEKRDDVVSRAYRSDIKSSLKEKGKIEICDEYDETKYGTMMFSNKEDAQEICDALNDTKKNLQWLFIRLCYSDEFGEYINSPDVIGYVRWVVISEGEV